MNGRHYAAQGRVQRFVTGWKDETMRRNGKTPPAIWRANRGGPGEADLLVADLETLMKPRVVVRTLAQLQALAPGTIIVVQGNRAAQVEPAEAWDLATGAEIEAKRLLYVGTDLYDNLLPDPSREELDTLRRMLPAIVIDPLD